LKGANVTRGIVPIRFNSEFINQEFGYYLLISGYVQKQIKEKTYGAALMQINIGDLREILTPFPPLVEQRAIVGRLEALSAETGRLEEIYEAKVDALEELKKSVLGRRFLVNCDSATKVLPQYVEPFGWRPRVGFIRLSRTEAGIYPAPIHRRTTRHRRAAGGAVH